MAPQRTTTFASVVRNGYTWAEMSTSVPKAPALEQPLIQAPAVLELPKMKCAEKNGAGVQFSSKYAETRITSEVSSFEDWAPNSEFNAYREKLAILDEVFRYTLQSLYPDVRIWGVGSYAMGIDIPSSDLDYTIEIDSLAGCPNPAEKLAKIRDAFSHKPYGFEEKYFARNAKTPCLTFKHFAGVDIDITIDNDTTKRNTQLMIWYCQVDSRVATLCRAIKFWASKCGVECSRGGRFNSFSLCLLVVHYLQKATTPAVLPNLQSWFPELNGENVKIPMEPSKRRNLREELELHGWTQTNSDSLGALYLGFFQYFRKFDFKKYWISIKRGTSLEKRHSKDKKSISIYPQGIFAVVEDPFLSSPWNCAGTVRQWDIYERIMEEFQEQYDWITTRTTIFQSRSVRREIINVNGMVANRVDRKTIAEYKNRKVGSEWPLKMFLP